MSDIFNTPIKFVNNYIERLRDAEPLNTLSSNPIMQADDRYIGDIQNSFKNLKADYDKSVSAALNNDKRQELSDLFLERQKYLKDLGGEEIQTFANRLNNWERETGLSFNGINVKDFGGAQHETISHHLPWLTGFSPDVQDKNIEQVKIEASPASPLNEAFASTVDDVLRYDTKIDLKKVFTGDKERLKDFYIAQGNYAKTKAVLNDPKTFLDASILSNPFREVGSLNPESITSPFDAELALRLNTANKILDQKFTQPLKQRYENLGKVQAPFEISRDFIPSWSADESLLSGSGGEEWRKLRNLSVEETNYNRLLNLAESLKRYSTLKNGGLGELFFHSDPVTAAVKGIPETARAIKRTPATLLPGAADLIPSPEAIRTGYAKGPIEMGKQMASEFVQSLPAAAASAGILSTPIAAPFAPGIGAGLVGAAAARAANEVVRQETGEGIVPKVRQFIGTALRTGVAAKPTSANQPLTAEIRPLSSKEKTNMINRENRNEVQRRIDLAGERFNPRRGEFGLSELLFGR